MLIDATHAEETRVVVVDGNKVEEFDFESENKRQLAGNIYLAKVTRVEPSLQAAFVDYGGNRHGFLAFSEIHPDYYQIPVADREALMEEERAYAEAMKARDEAEETVRAKPSRRRGRSKAARAKSDDAVIATEIDGMETIDLDTGDAADTSADGEDLAPSTLEHDADTVETASGEPSETEAQHADDGADAPEDFSVAEDAPGDPSDDADSDHGGHADPSDDDAHAEDTTDATAKDETIESVADEDDSDDIRPPRKPRPRRYKIQEVIKVRQILLVQVVKEERGNKGAALTTYLSLAGRYCVLMPNTARGGGISRKITNAVDRKKLKEIAGEIDVPQGAGLIVRTAGAKRTKAEIKRDYEYLQRLWEQIRELTLKSIAPAKIYEEGDLIKRSIRDLYNRDIDEVLVEGERGYRNAKDFMKMIMPSHAKNVKQYTDALPLFARFQVETYLAGMFNPTVQLRSGGYIVIGVTEALVAIDVNSGRATKEGSIEETALKTNLEAAEEVARQLRLRDLAGLIVIDFIDMDERKNNASVEKRLKERLKTDRARIQVGRISGFGLLEMSRQRLRPGMIEATTQPCPVCHGTGLIRSDDNLALSILRQVEEEGTRRRSREVLVKCPVGIANFLMNQKREHVAQIEARYGLSVRIEGIPLLVSPDFEIEKFKTATRTIVAAAAPVVSVDTSIMDQVDEAEVEVEEDNQPATEEGDGKSRRRRRRRRRGRGRGDERRGDEHAEEGQTGEDAPNEVDAEAEAEAAATHDIVAEPESAAEVVETPTQDGEAEAEAPKPKRRRTRKKKEETVADADAADASDGAATEPVVGDAPDASADSDDAEAAPKPKKRATRKRKPKVEEAVGASEVAEVDAAPEVEVAPAEPAPDTPEPEPAPEPVAVAEPVPEPEPVAAVEHVPEPAPEPMPEPEPVAANEVVAPVEEPEAPKKKRRGWWSLGK